MNAAKIKKQAFGLICTGTMLFAAAAAQAQSSVTLYGVADASLRFLTGANKAGKDQFSLTNGAISQSRWGLRGKEDLGGGTYAMFDLQSGFNLFNGAMSSSGVEFNRNAFVGIGNPTFGLVKLGQQDNPTYQLLTDGWDPLTVGNYLQNEWMPVAFSGALRGGSNQILYTLDRGPLTMRGSYALGGVAGNFNSGALKVLAIAYDPSPLGAEVGFVQGYNAADFKQQAFNVQLRYRSHPVEAWLGYYNDSDHTGSVDSFLTGGTAVGTAVARKDNAFVVGASYFVTSFFKLTGAAYYDKAQNVLGVEGADGKRFTYVALAEYFLSKQVTLYATVDYNKVLHATDSELPNGSDQFGAGTGIRYRF